MIRKSSFQAERTRFRTEKTFTIFCGPCGNFLVCCVLAFFGSTLVFAQTQPIVIEGGTLIDGTGRGPVPNSVIVIEGSRVKAVGVRGGLTYPPNARVIHAEGKTVLAGLIDGHVHFRPWMNPLWLHFGVTTVYDTGNPTEWILAQRDAVAKGKIKGPRIFSTGIVIDGPEERSNMNHPTERGGYRTHVRTPEEARATVRQLVSQKVDGIKVHEALTPELLKTIVEEARRAGLEIVGHSYNAREAVQAGLKFIEHTDPITIATIRDPAKLREIEEQRIRDPEYMMDPSQFDSLVEYLVREGVYFNPTLAINRYWRIAGPRAKEWEDYVVNFSKNPALAFVPEGERRAWIGTVGARQRMNARQLEQQALRFQRISDFTRRYAAANGKFIAGPDIGGGDHGLVPGLGLHFEMQALVDAGLAPMQAILSVTKWPAELLGKAKELGSLEAGKIADLILVEGDPLADISATRNIRLVMKEGQVIDTTFDPNFVNPMPRTVYVQSLTGPQGPEISAVAPKVALEGDRDLTIEIRGKKFNRRSIVRFDTTDLPTQFVSDFRLTAKISSGLFARIGTYGVTVVNPGSGGGTSNVIYFLVKFRD